MGLSEFRRSVLDLLGPKVVGSGDFRDDFWIQVKAADWLSTVDQLRGRPFLFEDFVDLCGVDYLEKRAPRFEVVLHVDSRAKRERIRVRCLVPDDTLTIPTLTARWPAANWQEREAFDQYGIRFEGHPNLERILNAPDITAFPQRKDYPLKGARDKKGEP